MSVVGLLSSVSDYLKLQEVKTDNAIFRLCYMFTTAMLVAFSLIITFTGYIGDPIQCINSGDVPGNVINTYCWIMTTFTMPDAHTREVGFEVPHPGLSNAFGEERAAKYYTYYQWVVFVLFFQALMTYLPKYIWDMWEGNLMKTIVMGMNIGMISEEEKENKKKTLIDYMLRHIRHHNMYAVRYFFCELLSFVLILVQMGLMDSFFDGEFMRYGSQVLSYSEKDQEERADPMIYVFPRVTKCTFHKFGPSGTITRHDSLCVLPLNIVNEKTYIFLWFWFIIITVLQAMLIIYRLGLILMPALRPFVFHFYHRIIPKDTCEAIARKTSLGDWWVLFMLGSNMDPLIYREVMAELAKKIETDASNLRD
ncbi:unnamed protein product [Cyprideis torosa]|uniref:Innexin n=1 Tax=Cyprideis torosa TaxID=163714 RepID=A0A7R8WEY5_9CRUS|nr:unnamed protein product [Cyprideis torosa]CAG0893460.1 unnamed protein product [Cyprideis torosa]